METLAGTSTFRHTTIPVETDHPTQFIDITDQLEALVSAAGLETGLVNIQTLHTTTAIVVNEHEPLLLTDFETFLDRWASPAQTYRHDDESLRTVNLMPGERANGHAHCQMLLLGTSACLNVVRGRLHLGIWQRVFLVELDGPRRREISIMAMGAFADERR